MDKKGEGIMDIFTREFPLPVMQSGAMLGNGKMGVLLWGEKNILNITLGCGDLWDHTAAGEYEKCPFSRSLKAKEEGDHEYYRHFQTKIDNGVLIKPNLIPLGRIVIDLGEKGTLLYHEIHIKEGLTKVYYEAEEGVKTLEFTSDMSCKSGLVCKGITSGMTLEVRSSFDLFRYEKGRAPGAHCSLEACNYKAPAWYRDEKNIAFCQKMPSDPSFSLLVQKREEGFATFVYREREDLAELVKESLPLWEEVLASSRQWWKEYWERIPVIEIPDEDLKEIYYSGLYKYGIMTNIAGPVPGLQGAWLEDDQLVPWYGGYTFDINVQMYYYAGLKAGLFPQVKHMLDMILSWKDRLRKYAKNIFEVENGYYLPLSSDENGMIGLQRYSRQPDPGSAAWIGEIMFDYCMYTNDMKFLKEEVFDFLKGCMECFRAFSRKTPEGKLEFPLTTSPEYRDTTGKNSSYHLAICHRLAGDLMKCAQLLGEKVDPFWKEVEELLPPYSIAGEGELKEIGVWEGVPLEESHRHHSHLGSICPFDTIDPEDPSIKRLMDVTEYHWVGQGMGHWSGWSMPWASQLRTRFGHSDAAVMIIKLWKDYFTNAGGGSLHNGDYFGFSQFASPGKGVMQIDGIMGSIAAIQDLYFHTKLGVFHFFRGVPKKWKETSFKGMFLPGMFRADGVFAKGHTREIVITAGKDASLKIRTQDAPNLFTKEMKKGEKLVLTVKDGKLVEI